MAQTKRKSTKSAPRSRKKPAAAAASAPDSYLPRPVWGMIYGVLGVLVLLTVMRAGRRCVRVMRTAIGSILGYGLYVLPCALFGLGALLIARARDRFVCAAPG